jgi:hypothetical protein
MIAAFILGRYLLHDAVSALLLRKVPNFEEIDRRIAKEGWKLVLLLRLSPLVPYNVSEVGAENKGPVGCFQTPHRFSSSTFLACSSLKAPVLCPPYRRPLASTVHRPLRC